MFTSKPRKINGLLLLAAVVGLVVGSAAPASATHLTIAKWASQGIGEEWGPSVDEFCPGNSPQTGVQFETTYYLITENVNYRINDSSSGTSTPVAHYQGLITMNIQHGDMVAAEPGARPGECLDASILVPSPIPLTQARISATNATNCASVDSTPGTYQRVNSNFKFDFNVSCTVVGNSGYTQTRMVWLKFDVRGTQNTNGYLKGITHNVSISGNGH